MKKHRRMLILSVKLLAGHSMEFADKFADDFAKYRNGTAKLHPNLVSAFKRFENCFGIAFKYRRFIEDNHQRQTGIYGDRLLAMLNRLEKGLPPDVPEKVLPRQFCYVGSSTLH